MVAERARADKLAGVAPAATPGSRAGRVPTTHTPQSVILESMARPELAHLELLAEVDEAIDTLLRSGMAKDDVLQFFTRSPLLEQWMYHLVPLPSVEGFNRIKDYIFEKLKS